MFYDIVQVIPNEDYTVYVYFEDGKIVCYDAKTLLKKNLLRLFLIDCLQWKILEIAPCKEMAVSYTHLDVYKRQGLTNRLYRVLGTEVVTPGLSVGQGATEPKRK